MGRQGKNQNQTSNQKEVNINLNLTLPQLNSTNLASPITKPAALFIGLLDKLFSRKQLTILTTLLIFTALSTATLTLSEDAIENAGDIDATSLILQDTLDVEGETTLSNEGTVLEVNQEDGTTNWGSLRLTEEGEDNWGLITLSDGGLGIYDYQTSEYVAVFNEDGETEFANRDILSEGLRIEGSHGENELSESLQISSSRPRILLEQENEEGEMVLLGSRWGSGSADLGIFMTDDGEISNEDEVIGVESSNVFFSGTNLLGVNTIGSEQTISIGNNLDLGSNEIVETGALETDEGLRIEGDKISAENSLELDASIETRGMQEIIETAVDFNELSTIRVNPENYTFDNTTSWTYSGWIRPEDGGTDRSTYWVGRGHTSTSHGIFFNPSDRVGCRIRDSASNAPHRDSTNAISLSQGGLQEDMWHQVACVYEPPEETGGEHNISLYINGEYQGSDTHDDIVDYWSSSDRFIGGTGRPSGTNGGSPGFMESVANINAYDRSLESEEIESLSEKEVVREDLIGWWPLNESTGQIAHNYGEFDDIGQLSRRSGGEFPEWEGEGTWGAEERPGVYSTEEGFEFDSSLEVTEEVVIGENNELECSDDIEGATRYSNGKRETCNGDYWYDEELDYSPYNVDYESCDDINENSRDSGDGVYWIAPEGDGGPAFPVYCDMTTDGGGWTLVLRKVNEELDWRDLNTYEGFHMTEPDNWDQHFSLSQDRVPNHQEIAFGRGEEHDANWLEYFDYEIDWSEGIQDEVTGKRTGDEFEIVARMGGWFSSGYGCNTSGDDGIPADTGYRSFGIDNCDDEERLTWTVYQRNDGGYTHTRRLRDDTRDFHETTNSLGTMTFWVR